MHTYIISNFALDDVDEDMEEGDSLDHHRSVTTGEDTAAERED